MRHSHFASEPRLLFLIATVLFTFHSAFAQTDFTNIVVFGDSLSDTGNVAHITQNTFLIRYPGNTFNYADGRFTDDTGTTPPAVLHTGVWVEQLAASLPAKPVIKDSLDGGTDYAYGDATTGNGTTNIPVIPGVSVNVNNMGQQVTDYLATTPHPDANTLYILWGGANDLYADDTPTGIGTAVANIIALAKRLAAAGATNILIPNLPPLGSIPKYVGQTAKITELNQASSDFRDQLTTALGTLQTSLPAVKIYTLDVYTLFLNIQAQPSMYNVTNITTPAQGANVIADNYLFWDSMHPTTTGHFLLANAAAALLPPSTVATTTTVTSSLLNANQGTSVTFTAVVKAAVGNGTPTGTVTFKDGTTTLGTGTITSGSAIFATSSLSAGSHTITAAYDGENGFLASTSASITQTVTAPGFSAAASPSTLMISRGASGTTTITVTPVGGFSATVNLACGTLPNPHLSCTFAPTSLAFTGSSTPMTSTLTIATNATMARNNALPLGGSTPQIFYGFILFPGIGFMGLAGFRKRRPGQRSLRLFAILAVLSAGAVLGLSGCGGSSNKAPAGTYTVPVNLTSGGSTTTINLQVTVQ